MFYIYILHSEECGQYYTGHTDDPQRRLQEHNTAPGTSFTSKHRPWNLVASFAVGETRGEAVKIERYIKKQKSRKFLLELIAAQKDPETLSLLLKPHIIKG
jgi:putative endonuclease